LAFQAFPPILAPTGRGAGFYNFLPKTLSAPKEQNTTAQGIALWDGYTGVLGNFPQISRMTM
jgi:hypothetical protein